VGIMQYVCGQKMFNIIRDIAKHENDLSNKINMYLRIRKRTQKERSEN